VESEFTSDRESYETLKPKGSWQAVLLLLTNKGYLNVTALTFKQPSIVTYPFYLVFCLPLPVQAL
jgi:hypothetical protein